MGPDSSGSNPNPPVFHPSHTGRLTHSSGERARPVENGESIVYTVFYKLPNIPVSYFMWELGPLDVEESWKPQFVPGGALCL